MHSPTDLRDDLAAIGLGAEDCVLVHSSMKAIGAVEGGPETVLEALAAQVRDGLLLLPTHSWAEGSTPDGIFDPQREPSCVGLLSERFRNRPGVIRSWHPTHSIAGLGKGAAEFLAGEEHTRTPCSRLGCWGRLYDRKAKLLFLGAPPRTNTFLHSVEEWYDVPDRLAATSTLFRIRTPAGALIDCPQFRHQSSLGDVSQHYGKIMPELLRRGIAVERRIGDARSYLCDARAMADYVGGLLRAYPAYFNTPE